MATYKVLQDIEAEDHLLGPLTLRQFIYACVAALCGYFCFIGMAKGAYFLLLPFGPIMLLAGFFAFPWRRDQPTEIWALAMVRFLMLPHKRIWDQTGAKDLVTITAPKKVETNYTNGLSQTEVKSRLKALADTIDSHGWAIKNVSPAEVSALASQAAQSDRLVDLASLTRAVASYNEQPGDDILDDDSATAEKFGQMIGSAKASRHERLVAEMQAAASSSINGQPAAAPPDNFWFLNQPTGISQPALDASVITPGVSPKASVTDDAALSATLKANKKAPEFYNTHMITIQPPAASSSSDEPTMTTDQASDSDDNQDDNAKIDKARQAVEQAELARSDDLTVATIARQAHKKPETDEVVINLH